jgi:hypothetical protein
MKTEAICRKRGGAQASAAYAERLWQRCLFFGYFLWASKESDNKAEGKKKNCTIMPLIT